MNRLIRLASCLLLCAAPLFAQDNNLRIAVDHDPAYPDQILKVEWWGEPDVYYLVECSLDMLNWDQYIYAVKGVPGDDGTGQTEAIRFAPFTGTNKAFFRLQSTDDPNSALARTDHDNDGIATADELDFGTDAVLADDDHDGDSIPTDVEFDAGLDPLNGMDGDNDADGDGVSNTDEYLQGRDPFGSAAVPDDGIINLVVFGF